MLAFIVNTNYCNCTRNKNKFWEYSGYVLLALGICAQTWLTFWTLPYSVESYVLATATTGFALIMFWVLVLGATLAKMFYCKVRALPAPKVFLADSQKFLVISAISLGAVTLVATHLATSYIVVAIYGILILCSGVVALIAFRKICWVNYDRA